MTGIGRLHGSIAWLRPDADQMREWGTEASGFWCKCCGQSNWPAAEGSQQLRAAGHEMASLHLERGIPLHEILSAISLFRHFGP